MWGDESWRRLGAVLALAALATGACGETYHVPGTTDTSRSSSDVFPHNYRPAPGDTVHSHDIIQHFVWVWDTPHSGHWQFTYSETVWYPLRLPLDDPEGIRPERYTDEQYQPPVRYMLNPTYSAFDSASGLWTAFGGSGPSSPGNQGLLRIGPDALVSGGSLKDNVVAIQDDGSGHLRAPEGIGFDARGMLWVADTLSDQLLGYDRSLQRSGGKVAPSIVITSIPPDGLDAPLGLAVDRQDDVWVAGSSGIAEFTAGSLTSSGSRTPARLLHVVGALGIAFDPAGNLWAAVVGTGVIEFTAAQLAAPAAPTPTLRIAPAVVPAARKLAFSPSGGLAVTTLDSVLLYSPAHVRAAAFGTPDSRIDAVGAASAAFPPGGA